MNTYATHLDSVVLAAQTLRQLGFAIGDGMGTADLTAVSPKGHRYRVIVSGLREPNIRLVKAKPTVPDTVYLFVTLDSGEITLMTQPEVNQGIRAHRRYRATHGHHNPRKFRSAILRAYQRRVERPLSQLSK
jgi:hypothetical protein